MQPKFLSELLNKDSGDISDYAGQLPKFTYDGYCTSFKCAGYSTKGIKKSQEDGPDNCPDCGYALVYRKRLRVKP